MSEQPINPFLVLDKLKSKLKITDTEDDDNLLQIVNNSNRKVQTTLVRYVDKTPIPVDDPIYSRCSDASLYYARSSYAESLEQFEKAKYFLMKYNVEMFGAEDTEGKPMAGGLIQELIARRTTRTKTVMITHDPRDFKVPLPCQNDLFVSERFA